MADTTMVSYDLKGKKLSFADWISNLSPTDSPFVSMTSKEAVQQTLFQWQTDSLEAVDPTNAIVEGSVAEAPLRKTTLTKNNVTQILRKVLKVSDTSNALANFGRGREMKYQMEKSGLEIKRDLEVILLSKQDKVDGSATVARRTRAFFQSVASKNEVDPDTGAIVHKKMELTESAIFDLTYNLYLSGSDAEIIMFHPKHANFFSSLQELSTGGGRVKMFSGDDVKFNKYISSIVDPLGREYKLIPNRWMPEDVIYMLCPKDWTQMILRAPERVQLAKDGSYEKWMIEMEVGLRHRHPFASGILEIGADVIPTLALDKATYYAGFGSSLSNPEQNVVTVLATTVPSGSTITSAVLTDPTKGSVVIAGKNINITGLAGGSTTITVTSSDGVVKTAAVVIHEVSVTTGSDNLAMYIGETRSALSVTLDPVTPAPSSFVWTSLDPAVITVNASTGAYTGVSAGFTRVRYNATYNGIVFHDQSGITVDDTVVTATPTTATVAVSATVNISTQISSVPAAAHALGYTYVSGTPANATVNPTTGVVTGVAVGSSVITATSVANPTKSATVTVTVTA